MRSFTVSALGWQLVSRHCPRFSPAMEQLFAMTLRLRTWESERSPANAAEVCDRATSDQKIPSESPDKVAESALLTPPTHLLTVSVVQTNSDEKHGRDCDDVSPHTAPGGNASPRTSLPKGGNVSPHTSPSGRVRGGNASPNTSLPKGGNVLPHTSPTRNVSPHTSLPSGRASKSEKERIAYEEISQSSMNVEGTKIEIDAVRHDEDVSHQSQLSVPEALAYESDEELSNDRVGVSAQKEISTHVRQVLTSTFGQNPSAWLPWETVCDTIKTSRIYRIIQVRKCSDFVLAEDLGEASTPVDDATSSSPKACESVHSQQ